MRHPSNPRGRRISILSQSDAMLARALRFELFIAARYLRAKRRQAIVGFITAFSVLGIMAGVAALIVALAITNGMRRDLQQRLLGATSHVELMRVAGDGIHDWRAVNARLATQPHVTAARRQSMDRRLSPAGRGRAERWSRAFSPGGAARERHPAFRHGRRQRAPLALHSGKLAAADPAGQRPGRIARRHVLAPSSW